MNINKLKTIGLKQLFLIDAVGAILSSTILFIIGQFEEVFGMPRQFASIMALFAFGLFIYSISSHLFIKANHLPYVGIVIVLNLLYSIISLIIIVTHINSLTNLGLLYFILELIVLTLLIILEYKIYSLQSL
jgi:tryptophan-rich sensory protein